MRNAVRNRYNPDYAEDYQAVMAAYDYWCKHDLLMNDDMARIFEYLYLTTNNFAHGFVRSCIDLDLNDSTLRRYRRRFTTMFNICLKAELEHTGHSPEEFADKRSGNRS